jgi:hypothetical protein
MYGDDMENKCSSYLTSFGYISFHRRRFGSMLKRAFKSHYPDADIKILFDGHDHYDDNEYDAIPDNDEDSCCSEDDDEYAAGYYYDSEDDDEYAAGYYYDSEDDDEDVDDEYYDCEEYGGASP